MRTTRTPPGGISAGLLLIAAFVAVSVDAASGDAETDAGMNTAPAPAKDPCLSALRAGTAETERICSDLIAGLRYEGAARSAEAALPGALNNRALARMRAGDLEGASADLTEALALAPGAWALYLNRANLALISGDAAGALDDLERVRELAPPGSAAARSADRNAVLAWRMLGNLDAAATLLARSPVRTSDS